MKNSLIVFVLVCFTIPTASAQLSIDSLLSNIFLLQDSLSKNSQVIKESFKPKKIESSRKKRLFRKDIVTYLAEDSQLVAVENDNLKHIEIDTASCELFVQCSLGGWGIISDQRIVIFVNKFHEWPTTKDTYLNMFNKAEMRWESMGYAIQLPTKITELYLNEIQQKLQSLFKGQKR